MPMIAFLRSFAGAKSGIALPRLLLILRPSVPGTSGASLITASGTTTAGGAGVREAAAADLLLEAEPDPFCALETCWLRHIDADHRDVVARLASRLPGPLRRGRVRPLGLDRYGVRLRVEGDDGDHDIRLPFARPVDDVQGLSQAIRILMGCPFVNGLRARGI